MLMSYVELVHLVHTGVIEHVTLDLINGSSIDITLGKTIMIEEEGKVVSLRDKETLNMTKLDMRDDGYVLGPGEFILAQSVQVFNLPLDISAEYKLKSSMARMGLEHMNAGWCDPGWNGSVLTMEFINLSRRHKIRIRPGDKIGQVVFFKNLPVPHENSYAARGRYNKQVEVVGAISDKV